MDSLVIKGDGCRISGAVLASGAKNAALPILIASMLTKETIRLNNVPDLADIKTTITLLESLGLKIESTTQAPVFDTEQNIFWYNSDFPLPMDDQHLKPYYEDSALFPLSVTLSAVNISNHIADYEIVRKMRAAFWVLAPLLARTGRAKVSLPGGCALGARKIELHIAVLEAMGAKIHMEKGYVIAKIQDNSGLKGCEFTFNKVSVGATITAILAAVTASGKTVLHNAAQEPEIVDLCNFLNQIGAKIDNIGNSTLEISGQNSTYLEKSSSITASGDDIEKPSSITASGDDIENSSSITASGDDISDGNRVVSEVYEYSIMPDRIEAGTYMLAAAITYGELKLYGIHSEMLHALISKLREADVIIEQESDHILVRAPTDRQLKATDIDTAPYPGFTTDWQPMFTALMTVASGTSLIAEHIFENRFMAVPELCRMGANISLSDAHHVVVKSKEQTMTGTTVIASDLRSGAALVIAALAAQGETKLKRMYHVDRGYQVLEKKLSLCGVSVVREKGDKV